MFDVRLEDALVCLEELAGRIELIELKFEGCRVFPLNKCEFLLAHCEFDCLSHTALLDHACCCEVSTHTVDEDSDFSCSESLESVLK